MKPNLSIRLWRAATLLAFGSILSFWGMILWPWFGPVPPCLPPELHAGYAFHDEDVMVVEAKEVPDILDFITVEEEPELLNFSIVMEGIYPKEAKAQGIEGMVVARVLVDENGKVMDYEMIRRAHPLLDAAAANRIPLMRFIAAKQEGQPVPFWVNIPFRFQLTP